jgi:hypothetical protein
MKEGLALNLIYKFGHDVSSEFPDLAGRYSVIYFFSEAGPVAQDIQEEVSQKIFGKTIGQSAMFSSLDDLKKFAMSVTQALKAPEVFILSVQDYNVGVEATRDVRAFRELYRRYGVNLTNPDVINRGPGLFGKFFQPSKKN